MPLTNVYNFIEHLWCDIEGVYVRGWVDCLADPITGLYMRSGDSIAEVTERISCADVAASYPNVSDENTGNRLTLFAKFFLLQSICFSKVY